MADDDVHNLKKINESCIGFNLVNTDLIRDSILHALKTGRSIGVRFNLGSIKTIEEKKDAFAKLPEINNISFKNDTIRIDLDRKVKTIRFIGQNGIEKKSISNSSSAFFLFGKEDTYIRSEIECNDGTKYFLNPFFRYDGIKLTYYASSYNTIKTLTWRVSFLVVLVLAFIVLKRRKTNV